MLHFLLNATAISMVVLFGILILMSFFLAIFVKRSATMIARLKKVSKALNGANAPHSQAMRAIFEDDETLSHLWMKYSETLHREQEPGNAGQGPGVLRSTVPAAAIFTTDSIVDARIWTEFFKHMPGIFTGLGILGTFSGLIRGLQEFDATAGPEAVKTSLAGLMTHVGDAFVISAIAIFLAMLTTTIERALVTVLYKYVENITVSLDGFFASGVGEDYLARLTRASERSAADSANLKDALVGDLKQILTDISERQIAAQTASVQTVGADVGRAVAETLREPLAKLTGTAERERADNGEAVAKLLTDVLVGFSQKMEEMFGGQISGINQLQQRTIDTLGAATEKLTGLVAGIQQASERSGDALNERLLAALRDMEAHQKAANERMSAFVDRMREGADQTQAETTRKLQETLSQIGVAVEAQMAAMREQADRSGAARDSRDEAATARTREMFDALGARVGEVLAAMREQIDRAGHVQADRDTRASAASEQGLARLTAAMEERIAGLREQGDKAAASAADRDAAATAQSAEALRQMGARAEETMAALRTHMDRIGETQDRRERELSDSMAAAIGNLATVAQRMIDETRGVAAGVSAAVDAMRGATTTAVDRMNEGSQTLYLAASEFKGAGASMAVAFKEAEGLAHGLRQSAGSVQEASASLGRAVADHAGARETLARMMEEMNTIVANARREAGATSEIVARIEAASQGLAHAEIQAERYLNGVNEILKNVHQSFNVALTNALDGQFQNYLANFTRVSGLLTAAAEKINEALQPEVRRAAE